MKQKPGLQKKVSSIFDGAPHLATSPHNHTGSDESPGRLDAGCSGAGSGPSVPQFGQNSSNTRSTAVLPAATGSAYGEPAASQSGAFRTERTAKSDMTALSASKTDSTRNHVVFMLAAVLILVGLLTVANLIGLVWDREETATGAVGAGQRVSPESYAARIYWKAPPPVPEDIRDITSGQNTSSHQNRLLVRGITYSDDSASAIIGKAIVHIGDEVMGATVVNIGRDYVEFEMKGKRWKQQVEK